MIESASPYIYGVPIASFAVMWMAVLLLIRRFSDRILDHPNEQLLLLYMNTAQIDSRGQQYHHQTPG